MKTLIIASVAALGFASPALAQEADAGLSGFRLEALAGLDRVNVDGDGESGVAYGVAGGYDIHSSSLVFGVEGEVAFASTDDCCTSAGRDLYAGGRIGTQIGDSSLLYVKAGYTNARIKSDFGNFNVDGVRIGLGLEQQLTSQFYVKGEYRYSNYELGLERHQVLAGVGARF